MVNVDGIWYSKKSDAPDLRSLTCVDKHGPNEMIRSYRGLQTDFSKLPKYDKAGITKLSLMTGSECIMCDTGNLYLYSATNKTWNQITI